MAPVFTVPAVATMAMGFRPALRSAAMAYTSASIRIRKSSSTGIRRRLSRPMPSKAMALGSTYALARRHRPYRARTVSLPRQLRLARHGERHQIGRRAAAAQAAVVTWTSNGVGQPVNDGPLDRHGRRRGPPRRDILVECRRQQSRPAPHRLTGASDIAEEAAIGNSRMFGDVLKSSSTAPPSPSSDHGREKRLAVSSPLVTGKTGRCSTDAQ